MTIPEEHIREVCKLGQESLCCRYLTFAPEGWMCAKLTTLQPTIDARVEAGTYHARGDNCDGIES